MVIKKTFLLLLIITLLTNTALAFQFEGFTKHTNGTNMTNVNVSLKVYQKNPGGPSSVNHTYTKLSNSIGYFNITVDDGVYGNSDFSFKPVLIDYDTDNYTALYIGNSLPDFPYEEFKDLGKVTFYLKQATTIFLSAFGDSHWAERVAEGVNTSLASDYSKGLEALNESGNLKWGYINESDCLIVLNSTMSINYTECDLNITNIKDFEFASRGGEYYFFVNETIIQRCSVTFGGSVDFNCTTTKDISDKNYAEVSGIEFTTFGGPGYDNIFISGTNNTGSHRIEKYNLTSLAFLEGEELEDFPAGKMESIQDSKGVKLYFLINDSGKSQIHECVPAGQLGPMQCYENTDFITEIAFDGVAHNGFDNRWYYANNVTNNITNFSFFTTEYLFNYQLKDITLGYPIDEDFGENPARNYTIYAPANRNYSIMIYPQGGPSFPARVNINNIQNGTTITSCNSTINENLFVNCSSLNLTTNLVWVSGYAKFNESEIIQNYSDYKILAYLLEAGDMVFKGMTLPSDMGSFGDPNERELDTYNTTTGFFNMTLPGSALGSNLLLYAIAGVNNSGNITYVGGFNEITLEYNSVGTVQNFTLYELMGNESDLEYGFGGNDGTISTKQKNFNLVNETGSIIQGNAFLDAEVDYSTIQGSNATFSWMVDSADGTFSLPIINQAGIKNMEIYAPNVAPLKTSMTLAELNNNETYNITLRNFKPYDPDNSSDPTFSETIRMDMYKSSTECSVPLPIPNCRLTANSENYSEFNPLAVILGGAQIDFEIRKTTNNITVRYLNVDLIASGPPDAMFDDSSNTSSGSLEEAWRFGSQGPEIYESIILGVPYNSSVINESGNVYVNITKLYADNNLNTTFWEQGQNTTGQLSGTEYETYATTRWAAYINGTGVLCSSTDENLTNGLCYKDTTKDMTWFKIPHFSGISPTISSSTTTGSNEPTSSSSSSSSSTFSGGQVNTIYNITKEDLEKGITKNLRINDAMTFMIGTESHKATLLNISATSAKLNISSDPIIVDLNLNEAKKVDVDNNKEYDLELTYTGLINNIAQIIIKTTTGKVEETNKETTEETTETTKKEEEKEKSKVWAWITTIILLIALIIVIKTMIKTTIKKKIKKN